MKWVALGLAGAALLAGCQDLDGPAEPPLPSNPVIARASGPFVAAPSNANAVVAPGSRIDISWQDNSSNETEFEIHRSTTGVSGIFSLLATTAANIVAYSDQGLEVGVEYCYRIRAVRGERGRRSYSPFSNIACARLALPAPSNANASAVSENQIDLSWQDNSNETRFEIFRSTDGGNSFGPLTTTAADVAAHSDQGLAPGSKYCYLVRAVRVSANGALYSEFSNTACATTPPPPAPASETDATPGSSSTVIVSWTDNSTTEDGFRIYRSTDGGAVWNLAGTVGTNGGSVGSMFDAGPLISEQPVCYRVVAFNGAGDSPTSNTACTIPPAGPTNLTLTAVTADTSELTWVDNSAVEDGYEVVLETTYNSSGPTCRCVGSCDADMYALVTTLAELPPNSTSYRTTEVMWCGTRFYVMATKDGGHSNPSFIP